MTDLFERMARTMVRRRWLVLLAWLFVLGIAGALLAPQANSVVKGGGFVVSDFESAKADQILEQDFQASPNNNVFVVFHSSRQTTDSPGYRRVVSVATQRMLVVPNVGSVTTFFNSGNPSLVSRDRHTTLAMVDLKGDEGSVPKIVPRLRQTLMGLPMQHFTTGVPAIQQDIFTASEQDLRRSELFTIPIVLILLLLVFRTAVAASIPLLLAICTVVAATGVIALVASVFATSIFALNVASMIGLGLSIDYSLIIVSRYREERASGKRPDAAVVAAMTTAGRSITYSGIIVMLCMLAVTILLWNLMIVRSISLGVMLIAVMGLLAGLTLLPAVLALLGDRIEWLRIVPAPRRGRPGQAGFWYRLSHVIMRWPWAWAALSFLLLGALILPVLNLSMVGVTTSNLPAQTESVQGARVIGAAFGSSRLAPIQIVVKSKQENGIWNRRFLASLSRLTDAVKADPRSRHVYSLSTLLSGIPHKWFLELKPEYFTTAPHSALTNPNLIPPLPGVSLHTLIEARVDHVPAAPAFVGLGRFTMRPGGNIPVTRVPALQVLRLTSGSLTILPEGKVVVTRGGIGPGVPAPTFRPSNLHAGDQMVIPEGTALGVRNQGVHPAVFLCVSIFVIRSSSGTQTSWTVGKPSSDSFDGLPRQVLSGGVILALPSGAADIQVDRSVIEPRATIPRHTHPGPELVAVESGALTIFAAHPNQMTVTLPDGRGELVPFDSPITLPRGAKALVQAGIYQHGENRGTVPTSVLSARVVEDNRPPFSVIGPTQAAAQFINLREYADTAVITILPRYGEYSGQNLTFIRDLRHKIIPAIPQLQQYDVYVGGNAASFLDFRDALYDRFPIVVAVVMVMIFLILMMFFRSVVLPLKAMFMNLLTVLATYGVLVIIFQYGFATNLLDFRSQGLLNVITPAILYVILFALSTDYEVFMLSRVKEYYRQTANNEEAVAAGLQRTGGVITAAGLILVGTFGSFAVSRTLVLKELGLGLAIGVLLDMTVVRVIMVPALMRLMGRANWWMPAWLVRILPEIHEGGRPIVEPDGPRDGGTDEWAPAYGALPVTSQGGGES